MSHAGLPRRARIAALCASLGAALPVFAGPDSAAVLGHYTFSDSARQGDNGYGGRFVLTTPLTARVSLESSLYGDTLPRKGGDADAAIGLGIDASYSLLRRPYFEPFVLFGAGAEYERPAIVEGSRSVAPYLDAGLGVHVPLAHRLGLRIEARENYVFNSGAYPSANALSDVRVGLGLQYHFGEERPLAFLDRHHEVPAETPKACCDVVDAPAAPSNLPPPLCPTPPAGFAVDADGCLVAQTTVVPAISFSSNTAKLSPGALQVLNQLAEVLIQEPDIGVAIGGHSDSSGSQEANLTLSQKRASAVANYLIEHGVAPERVRADGYGDFKPVASNATPAGRAQNRRVEFTLTRG